MFERTRAAFRAFFADEPPLETRFSNAGPLIVTGRTGSAVYSPWSSEKFALEGYASNIIAFLCCRLVADAFASLPLLCFRGERELPQHPLAKLLDRPNKLQGQDRFLQSLAIYHLISGNSFVEAVRPGKRSPPRELYTINPRRMSIIPGPVGLPSAYRFEAAGGKRDYPVDPIYGYGDMLHLREPNPLEKGEEWGFSPTQAAGRWIDLDNSGADRRIQHSSGSDPDIAFLFGDITSQDQLDIANAKLRQRWEDTRRAQTPFAIGGNASVVKLGQSLREMQWTEGMDAAARRICAAWNVPHVLVVPGESTYANREMAHLELWEHTVLPFAKLMLGDLVPWFRFLFQDDALDIRVDEDGISALEPRRATIRETSLLAFEKGMLSLNEARLVWGYEPAVESDDPAEEPAALRNARQAAMLAEAQQEALRSPQEQQEQRPGFGGGSDDEEEEEEEEEERATAREERSAPKPEPVVCPQPPTKPGPSWQDQGRVPAGEEGAGRFAANTLSPDAFARWLRTGRKGEPPGQIECKAEADDFADDALDDEALAAEMAPVVRQILIDSGVRVFAGLSVEVAFDVFDERVTSWLESYSAERVSMISETTRKELRTVLAQAMREGSRFDQLVTAIRGVMQDASRSRTEVIARTETTAAIGAGGQIGMEQAGVERKRWVATADSFTRDAHRALSGQTVPVDERFSVPSTSGYYPGAMSGGAAQNANCRCFVQPIADEKADSATDTEEKRDALWKAVIAEVEPQERELATAVRQGFARQEAKLVIAAWRRWGSVG